MALMSDDETEFHLKHRRTIDAIAHTLPDNVLKQVLGYVPRAQQYLLLTKCRPLSIIAHASLYSHLKLENRERVDRLMACRPNPDEVAPDVEFLEIPGSLLSPAREYIARLIQRAGNLEKLKVGYRDSNDSNLKFIPDPPEHHHIRTLIVGEHSRDPLTDRDRLIHLSELSRFPYLTQLHWCPIDVRIGSVQSVFATIHHYCRHLNFLQMPWSNRLDKTPWESLPSFENLRRLTIRFEHNSQIDLIDFVKFLRMFYERNVAVQVGSGCAVETVKWLQDLYFEVFCQELNTGYPPHEMLRWIIQNNRGHLLKLTDLPSPAMRQAMYDAIRQVDCSDGDGLRIEIDLTYGELPDILRRNLRYLRLQVNRQNVSPNHIPEIIRSNPRMTSIIVAKHVVHHGGSYDGNCTHTKVPLIPRQNVARHSGQRSTVPGFELKYRLRRDENGISQIWRSYPSARRGPPPLKSDLTKLNVFGVSNFVEQEWSEPLLKRLHAWENEIKGWFDLSSKLMSIGIVLNTDQNKFGRVEKYWCTCNENDHV